MKKLILLVSISLLGLYTVSGATDGTILIKNARIYPVVGAPIEKGDLLIRDGKIAGIGTAIEAPADAKVIDASGMEVYPGFIDAYTHLGLVEVFSIAATMDTSELGRENPEVKVTWALNPQSVHFATSRTNGTTSALVAPSGGTFSGISAIVRMDGWNLDDMLIKDDAGMIINFPVAPRPIRDIEVKKAEGEKDEVTVKLIEKIRNYLNEARRYNELKKASATKGTKAPDFNAKYEALLPVLEGKMLAIISVEKAKDIKLAIKFVKDEKLKAVFHGCEQGFQVADQLAEAKIPVILDSLYTGPSDPEDAYDSQWTNAAALVKAGVKICFSTGNNPADGKNLPYYAARAVAFGLDHDKAIEALTINPARFFGLDGSLGSLETGKDADLFITTGDPLDCRSVVKYLFIKGKMTDMDNWWETMYKKWEKRPL
jgi:imidazolonepropionase-like amidohydrolase